MSSSIKIKHLAACSVFCDRKAHRSRNSFRGVFLDTENGCLSATDGRNAVLFRPTNEQTTSPCSSHIIPFQAIDDVFRLAKSCKRRMETSCFISEGENGERSLTVGESLVSYSAIDDSFPCVGKVMLSAEENLTSLERGYCLPVYSGCLPKISKFLSVLGGVNESFAANFHTTNDGMPQIVTLSPSDGYEIVMLFMPTRLKSTLFVCPEWAKRVGVCSQDKEGGETETQT